MSVQYQTQVDWDINLRDAEYTDASTMPAGMQGLVQTGVYIRSGAPLPIAGKYIPGAIVQNAIDGTSYMNKGTTASPVFSLIDTSTGGLPALPNGDIWVGNGSNVATAVVPSGDVTMDNAGAFTVNVLAASFMAGFIPTAAAPQALSGPGAITLTSLQTQFTSTGIGDALTLANGTKLGQLKKVSYIAESAGADTGVITPATGTFTTATLNAIGDYIVFMWIGTSGWMPVEFVGVTVV